MTFCCCVCIIADLLLKMLLQVIVTDTAGMRQTLDPIEAEGVAVAHKTAQQADVVLSVLDCMAWQDSISSPLSGAGTRETDGHTAQDAVKQHSNAVTILNKADALTQQQLQQVHLQLQQQQQQQWENQSGGGHHQQQQQISVQQSNVQQNYDQQPAPQGQLQQHAYWQKKQQAPDEQQQQQQEVSQQAGSSHAMPSTGASCEQKVKTLSMDTCQLQSMHSMRAVVCSCKTGWNMDEVLRLLEQSVQAIMQSGQESEEALVITRYSHTMKPHTTLGCLSNSALLFVKIQTIHNSSTWL